MMAVLHQCGLNKTCYDTSCTPSELAMAPSCMLASAQWSSRVLLNTMAAQHCQHSTVSICCAQLCRRWPAADKAVRGREPLGA